MGDNEKGYQTLMNVKGERFEFETEMLLATGDGNADIVEIPIETLINIPFYI